MDIRIIVSRLNRYHQYMERLNVDLWKINRDSQEMNDLYQRVYSLTTEMGAVLSQAKAVKDLYYPPDKRPFLVRLFVNMIDQIKATSTSSWLEEHATRRDMKELEQKLIHHLSKIEEKHHG